MTLTIQQQLAHAAQALAQCDQPRLEAEVLLQQVLQCSRSYLYAHADDTLSVAHYRAYCRLLQQRIAGQPIAYLTGQREFWSLPLSVSPATLIPRPETELLVEQALLRLPHTAAATVFDLGTGSGAIALAIAHERPQCRVIASDIAAETLQVARDNARRLQLTQVEFRQGDWWQPFTGERAAVIVSNPPYIAADDPHLQRGDVRYEPQRALVAAENGLSALRQVIQRAPEYLHTNGSVLLEHGYQQGAAVRQALQAAGFEAVQTVRDLSGQERVSLGVWRRN